MNSRSLTATFTAVLFVSEGLVLCPQAQSGGVFGLGPGHSSAVDAKGVRHYDSDYPKKVPPWIEDRIKAVFPEYPSYDRLKRHEGTGLFKLSLDLKTGIVSTVSVMRSTGFSTLDDRAIAALRQWRSKPGKWREIQMPVRFSLSQSHRPGSIPFP